MSRKRKKHARKPRRYKATSRGYAFERYFVGPSRLQDRLSPAGCYGTQDFVILECAIGSWWTFAAAVQPDPTGMSLWQAQYHLKRAIDQFERSGGVADGVVDRKDKI